MENITPLFESTYNVSQTDYIDFNWLLLGDDIIAKKKKANITGWCMLIVSILLGVQTVIFNKYNQYILDLLIVFVFFIGIYDILFYKKIFPKSLKKNAIKVYQTTRFAKGCITLKLFDKHLVETSCEGDVDMLFSTVDAKYENDKLLVLFFNNRRTVIINKNSVSDDFLDFLKGKV